MARILIAGCGYTGSVLGERLVASGHEVWGLRRSAVAPGDTSFSCLEGDLTDPESLRQVLPEDLDFAVHAASPRLQAGGSVEESYRAVYLDGLSNLLRVLQERRAAPRRVFFVSSTSVYGQKRGEWVDEDSPTHPTRKTGDILLLAERLLRASEVPGTTLRLGGIYGPGRTRLIDSVRAGRAVIATGEPHYTNRIHRDDAARALEYLLELDEPAPLYLGVDSEPAAEQEVLRWMSERLEVEPLRRGPREEGPELRRSGSKRCRNARLLETGFVFAYPSFREGYGAML